MYTLLFQGDSLTDACREKQINYPDTNRVLGNGYVYLAGAYLMSQNPNIRVINHGVNGNRIVDLYARWTEDTLNQSFDLLSILCGINDVGFQLRLNRGVEAEKYKFIYDRMLTEVKTSHPEAKLVLCEPFVFKMNPDETPAAKDIYENWDLWNLEISKRSDIVDELAEKYQCVLVPSKKIFEEACRDVPGSHWSIDGIHLSPAGNALLAEAWVNKVVEAGYVSVP